MDTILSRERKMAKKLSTPKLVWVTFPLGYLLPSTSKQVFGCVCDPGHCLQSPWWETEGDFVLEPTNLSPQSCYHRIWTLLQNGNTSESAKHANLISRAPFKLLLAWKSVLPCHQCDSLLFWCFSPFVLFLFQWVKLIFCFCFPTVVKLHYDAWQTI